MTCLLTFFPLTLYISATGAFVKNVAQNHCGYLSCPSSDPYSLNVHIIAHTHDDVGWVKTVDRYYYESVQYILDSIVEELRKDKTRRFTYVESAFFFKWWEEQTLNIRSEVKAFVDAGRLQFAGGGWSMNDEATTHYQNVIDQMSWGLRKLNDTFGNCGRPKIGWQIDPFGHSREMAFMLTQMGFDALFFGRVDYQDKRERFRNQEAEMIWKSAPHLGGTNLFTGILYNTYSPPPGFCFDVYCSDEPFIEHGSEENIKLRVDQFVEYVAGMSRVYKSNNVLVTMGNDFNYVNANTWFKNLDKLIKYTNMLYGNKSINVMYSTPACYFKSINNSDINWPVKYDDFFPYASDPHSYWTGYYSSRPTVKKLDRDGNHILQVCKQLTALSPRAHPSFIQNLGLLREAMGVLQHHDAVSGTEKQNVASDYALKLGIAKDACIENCRIILNQWSTLDKPPTQPLNFNICPLLNISSCELTNLDKFVLTLYNPLLYTRDEYVRVPLANTNYEIVDFKGKLLKSQYVPIPQSVLKLKFRNSSAKYELIFLAEGIPAMGYKTYYVHISRKREDKKNPEPEAEIKHKKSESIEISNGFIKLQFAANGRLTRIYENGAYKDLKQEFLYYESYAGNNDDSVNRSSGAYIFRPSDNNAKPLSPHAKIRVYRGDLVEEVHQEFGDWVSQVVRLYRKKQHVEFEWTVGPIPVEDNIGKEVISRFETAIDSKRVFYTDSNGRGSIKRIRNHRNTWNLTLLEPSAGNYYPVASKIALEDDHMRLSILTDRTEGGSSLSDGSLELMVHRRLLHDDGFGVEEALNETAYGAGVIVRGKHYLFFGSSKQTQSGHIGLAEKFTVQQMHLPPLLFFSKLVNLSLEDWRTSYNNFHTSVAKSVPRNVHILTMEPWHENELLIRFENIFDKNEVPELSNTTEFNLMDIFRGVNISHILETTLDGNVLINNSQRAQFDQYDEVSLTRSTANNFEKEKQSRLLQQSRYVTNNIPLCNEDLRDDNTVEQVLLVDEESSTKATSKPKIMKSSDTFMVALEPMQIKTFLIVLQ